MHDRELGWLQRVTLPEMGKELWRLVLVNVGGKLAVGDSPVIEEQREREQEQTHVQVGDTWLKHFGLFSKKAVGSTANALDIVASM